MALGDDNRTPKEDSSSSLLKAFNNSSSNSTSQPQQIPHDDSAMPPWAILLIVAISIVSLAIQEYNKYPSIADFAHFHWNWRLFFDKKDKGSKEESRRI
jgi:hypothetical protein